MLRWIREVAADALRLRRQAALDTQADHAERTSREISARAEKRRVEMLAKVGEPAAKREPGLCYPQSKF